MEFDYTITTAKTFDQAVLSVQGEIAKGLNANVDDLIK